MYGMATKHAAVLPATGLSGGLLGYGATGLALVTLGIMIIAILGLARRRNHARP